MNNVVFIKLCVIVTLGLIGFVILSNVHDDD